MITFIAERAEDTEDSRACFGQLHTVRGSPFPALLQEKWKARFGVRRAGSNSYGLTEAARVTGLRCDEEAPPGSSGRANADLMSASSMTMTTSCLPRGHPARSSSARAVRWSCSRATGIAPRIR